MPRRVAALVTLIAITVAVLNAADPAKPPSGFELKPGDHICIIGNSLAERMQHYGWLETLLHAQFPQHELVIRNLGYSGDTVTKSPLPTRSTQPASISWSTRRRPV